MLLVARARAADLAEAALAPARGCRVRRALAGADAHGSMFNPEPTDLFVSTLCLYLAARMLVRRQLRLEARRSSLGLALGVGEMVRQFSLWTLAVVVLAFLVAIWKRPEERRAVVRALAVVARRRRRDRRAVVRLPRGELRQRGLRPAALVEAALGAPARRASTSRPACRRSSHRRTGRTSSTLRGRRRTRTSGATGTASSRGRASRMRSRRRCGTVGSSCSTIVGLDPDRARDRRLARAALARRCAGAIRRDSSSRCYRSPGSPAISSSPSAIRRRTATC